jgi:DNA polymerase
MVKCWVGEGNPDPKQTEIDTCAPWLDQQLQLIKPKGVITFGKFSTNKFIEFPNKGGIGQIQGHIRRAWWDSTHPTYIMPLYHPAYLARSRDEIPNTTSYLVKFRELIDDLIW